MSAVRRFRYTLAAGATAVVIGAGFTVAGISQGGPPAADRAAADLPLTAQSPADLGATDGAGDDLLLDEAAAASLPPSAPPATPASSSPTPKASTKATPKPKTRTKASPSPRPTKKKTSTPKPTSTRTGRTSTAPATSGSVLDQVLAHINEARTKEGLSAYTLNADLSKASALHNQLMIDGCGLSHQCSGEGGIGDRFSAQGVTWSSAGENIGYGSAGSSTAEIVKAANGLTDSMLAEVPPEDGHRKNLLSTGFKKIGLSIVRDGKGVVWMTQDFTG